MNKHIYLGLSILMSIVMNEYKYEWIWMEWIFKYEYVIVWICKTKILWKSKTLLYGYWQVHCPHKNRLYLQTHCRRCRARFDISICELNRPLPKEKNKKVTGVMKSYSYANPFAESYRCNERWLTWKNLESICWIKSKNLSLLNRWLQ